MILAALAAFLLDLLCDFFDCFSVVAGRVEVEVAARRTESFPLDEDNVSCLAPAAAFESCFLDLEDDTDVDRESDVMDEGVVAVVCDFELRRLDFVLSEDEDARDFPGPEVIGMGMMTMALPESFLILSGMITDLIGAASVAGCFSCASSLTARDFLRSPPDFLLFFVESGVGVSVDTAGGGGGGGCGGVDVTVDAKDLPFPLASFLFLDDEDPPL
jgi:hypothetical protein